jgi:hypothetical protein
MGYRSATRHDLTTRVELDSQVRAGGMGAAGARQVARADLAYTRRQHPHHLTTETHMRIQNRNTARCACKAMEAGCVCGYGDWVVMCGVRRPPICGLSVMPRPGGGLMLIGSNLDTAAITTWPHDPR